MVDGLALRVKSWTVKLTVAVRERDPLMPVTTTATLPATVNVHDRVDVPEPDTLVGLRLQWVSLAERLTMPANPF